MKKSRNWGIVGFLTFGALSVSAAAPSETESPAQELSVYQAVQVDLVAESRRKALDRDVVVREMPEPTQKLDKAEMRRVFGNRTVPREDAWQRPAKRAQAKAVGSGFIQDLAVESVDMNAVSVISGTFVSPPDTMGFVGPTEFFTVQNGAYRIHDKVTGASASLDVAAEDFWVAAVDPNDNGGGDPRVRYDRFNDRWVVVAFELGDDTGLANNRILLAVSDGPTLDGSTVWTQFYFVPGSAVGGSILSGCFADYPTLGMDHQAIYIGANMLPVGMTMCGASSSISTAVFVISLDRLPAAGSNVASVTTALTDLLGTAQAWTPTPADNYDPGASQGYVMATSLASDTTLRLGKISNPTGVPGTPSLSWSDVAINNKNDGFLEGVPYPGVPNPDGVKAFGLDPLALRVIGGAQVRDGRLWTTMTSSVSGPNGDLRLDPFVGDRHSVVFFEIDVAMSSLIQDGNFYDSTSALNANPMHLFVGSITVNGQGHAVAGATGAKRSLTAPSAVWGARRATDPLGEISPPTVYRAGINTGDVRQSFETGARLTRWGDYSQVSVDPCDDMSFYVIQQYQDSPASLTGGNWATGLARILAPAPTFESVQAAMVAGTVELTVTGSGFYSPPTEGMPACRRDLTASSDSAVTVQEVRFENPQEIVVVLDGEPLPSEPTTLKVTNPDGQSVSFEVDLTRIFSDGFESGDTSAWQGDP